MDKIDKALKTLYHKLGREYSLNGIEKQILWVLIQSEINIPGGIALGTHNALMNFKKRSSIRRAYEEFHKNRIGRVSWRSPQES